MMIAAEDAMHALVREECKNMDRRADPTISMLQYERTLHVSCTSTPALTSLNWLRYAYVAALTAL